MIRTLTSSAVLALSLLSAASLVNAQPWVAGEHYRVLDNPVRTASDNGVEVAEVFWYGCPHCYNFKPLAEAWEAEAPDYINYVKLPAALGRSWEPHAYAFYALEAMGELDKVHDALFDALAGERRAPGGAVRPRAPRVLLHAGRGPAVLRVQEARGRGAGRLAHAKEAPARRRHGDGVARAYTRAE